MTACKPETNSGPQAGKAFLDSQIPPGLSPQYYPPEGFVWGGYQAKSLPEARYGVASPPVNPKAQVLIIADADYPAEVYFEAARQLLSAGYGVWIIEPPGQGGSGRYAKQPDKLDQPDFRHTRTLVEGFVRDVIAPSPSRPLYVVGTGFSGVTALSVQTTLKDRGAVNGFIAFDPYTGGDIFAGEVWTRDRPVATYWGGIAQNWQMSNPDLRLRVKSEQWVREAREAYNDLSGLRLPAFGADAEAAGVMVVQSRSQSAMSLNASAKLCAQLSRCKLIATDGPEKLGAEIAAIIAARRATA